MSEKLTLSVGDGTTKKLRTLAGGERKIGVWLTITAAWLFDQKDTIGGRDLSDFTLWDSATVAEIQTHAAATRAEIERTQAQIAQNAAELARVSAEVAQVRAFLASQAQENGGKDDAQQNAKRKTKRDA